MKDVAIGWWLQRARFASAQRDLVLAPLITIWHHDWLKVKKQRIFLHEFPHANLKIQFLLLLAIFQQALSL